MEEVHTIANLALTYHFLGKDYSIITPYDPQRAAIVAALKASDLPYDNVYNVDSFQGTICCSLTYVFTMPDTKLLTLSSLRKATKLPT